MRWWVVAFAVMVLSGYAGVTSAYGSMHPLAPAERAIGAPTSSEAAHACAEPKPAAACNDHCFAVSRSDQPTRSPSMLPRRQAYCPLPCTASSYRSHRRDWSLPRCLQSSVLR